MSEFFIKKNSKEVGPGPSCPVKWLLIDKNNNYCIVVAKSAFDAEELANIARHRKGLAEAQFTHWVPNVKEFKVD